MVKNIVPLNRPAREAAISNAKLTYRGGPLIQNVEISAIYWGSEWNSSLTQTRTDLDKFLTYFVTSPGIDQLAEYNIKGHLIGHGRYLVEDVVASSTPPPRGCLGSLFPKKPVPTKVPANVTDADIQNLIVQELNANRVAKVTPDSLYMVFTPPGTTVTLDTYASCQNFCGYHSNVNNMYYAVIPYPDCVGCMGTMKTFDSMTSVITHEICEAITDPVPGTGWYDDVNGEIGDICAWHTKQLGGYAVQLEWSNVANKCV